LFQLSYRLIAIPEELRGVGGEADFIVTGDKALQQLKEYQGIKIINAEQLISVFGE